MAEAIGEGSNSSKIGETRKGGLPALFKRVWDRLGGSPADAAAFGPPGAIVPPEQRVQFVAKAAQAELKPAQPVQNPAQSQK